jgi:hypothetical protein
MAERLKRNAVIKSKRFLCAMLSMLIIISGIYFGNARVDNMSLKESPVASVPSIHGVESVLTDTEACTSEMLGIRLDLSELTVKCARTGRNDELAGILCFYGISMEPVSISDYDYADKTTYDCHSEKISDYIHNSDGKKRIS